MIARYTHPDMGAIWSDQRRYETWLEVELAATDAMADAGLIPRDAAAELRAKAAFDPKRIEEIEAVTQHDVIAFTTAVAEQVGPAARYLHFGLTSSDVIDTAQALQMRQACGLIIKDISALMAAVASGAREVIAIDLADEKLALARELGATATFNAADKSSHEAIRSRSAAADAAAARLVAEHRRAASRAAGRGGGPWRLHHFSGRPDERVTR